ncbi:MAG: hypothetical protein DRN06_03535 [Thermoprotei archaeon]|nr:MAG: hypothetical protein DRN06_03535 [Thermoprotei archaeon]
MSLLQGFSFKKGVSLIHRLDPRSKLLLVFSLASSAIIFRGFLLPSLALLLLSLGLIVASGCAGQWLKTLKGLILLSVFIFLVNWWYVDAFYAASMVSLLITLVASLSLSFLTTIPDDLSLALVKLGLPYELALELSMAIRFVPTLAREAQLIIDAQRARGLDLEAGFIKRLRNLIPILIPLVINTVRRSYRVAEAMESRAFGASPKRTWLFDLKFRGVDYLVTISSFALLALSFFLVYRFL